MKLTEYNIKTIEANTFSDEKFENFEASDWRNSINNLCSDWRELSEKVSKKTSKENLLDQIRKLIAENKINKPMLYFNINHIKNIRSSLEDYKVNKNSYRDIGLRLTEGWVSCIERLLKDWELMHEAIENIK